MGGRGASKGISDKGIKYGKEYSTLFSVDNIKFIVRNEGAANAPLETMSASYKRIYVTVNKNNELKAITLFDKMGKRHIEIHLREHFGVSPHMHIGYVGTHTLNNTFPLDKMHRMLLNKVLKYWKEYNEQKILLG